MTELCVVSPSLKPRGGEIERQSHLARLAFGFVKPLASSANSLIVGTFQ